MKNSGQKVNNRGMFFKRIFSIAVYTREELLMILKDKAVLLIFIIANVIYPVIYSIAYDGEQVKEEETAIVDLDKSASSRKMRTMIDATEGLNINYEVNSIEEARELFYNSKVKAIILIPEGFEKDIYSGTQTTLSLYADASYFLLYKQAYSSVVGAYRTYAAGIQLKKSMAKGANYQTAYNSLSPVNFKNVDLYNPNSSYGSFVMPSIILVILQQTLLIGIGILGGTRKEVMRYNFLMPVKRNKKKVLPFLLGKAGAYFITFLIMGIFTLVWVHHWFGFPHKSSYLSILALYVPYILANIFLGLTISVFFRHRENAMLFMVFLSIPVLFLSGASWPAEAIPPFLRNIASVFPSSFMVPAYQRVRTMGAELSMVRTEIFTMLGQCLIYFVLSVLAFKHVLHRIIKTQKNSV